MNNILKDSLLLRNFSLDIYLRNMIDVASSVNFETTSVLNALRQAYRVLLDSNMKSNTSWTCFKDSFVGRTYHSARDRQRISISKKQDRDYRENNSFYNFKTYPLFSTYTTSTDQSIPDSFPDLQF